VYASHTLLHSLWLFHLFVVGFFFFFFALFLPLLSLFPSPGRLFSQIGTGRRLKVGCGLHQKVIMLGNKTCRKVKSRSGGFYLHALALRGVALALWWWLRWWVAVAKDAKDSAQKAMTHKHYLRRPEIYCSQQYRCTFVGRLTKTQLSQFLHFIQGFQVNTR